MKKRIITAIILAIIILPMLCVQTEAMFYVFEVFLCLLAICAEAELLNMYDKQKKVPPAVKILCILSTLLLYASIVVDMRNGNGDYVCKKTIIFKLFGNGARNLTSDNEAIQWFFNIINGFSLNTYTSIGLIFFIMFGCLVFVDGFDASDIGKSLVSIIYIGVTFASILVLRSYGIRFVIFLAIICCLTDIFALVFGLSFGKHKMAPKISPKKSWEGAIGGSCVAVIVGFLFLYLYRYISPSFHNGEEVLFFESVFSQSSFTEAGIIIFMILICLFMSIFGQVGDLVASKLKRTYGIKDYSNVFPGHGGVLDRFDSMLFAAVAFLIFVQLESIIFPVIC